eukprot:m.166044 g.166044  ORF g.166044 m.166044 type:complete len:673 (+) comp16610_c0_seq1:86-2104(+)
MSQRPLTHAFQQQLRHMAKDARGATKASPVKTINRGAPPPPPPPPPPPSSTTGSAAKAQPQTPIRSIKIEQAGKPPVASKSGAFKVPVQGQTPPPVPPPAGWTVTRVLGFGAFASATVITGTLAYAARDDTFREQLETRVPGSAEILEFFQQSSNTKSAPVADVQAPLGNVKTPSSPFVYPSKEDSTDPVPEPVPEPVSEPVSDPIVEAPSSSSDEAPASTADVEVTQVPDAILPEVVEPQATADEAADEADIEPGLPLELSEASVAHMTSQEGAEQPTDSTAMDAASQQEEDAALVERVTKGGVAVALSTTSAAELEAELAQQEGEPVAVTTLEDAEARIKALEAQLADTTSQEADRTHSRLTQQAHQHEAFFNEQLAQVQSEHAETLSRVISDLRAALAEQFEAREAALRDEKQLEIQQHLKVQADKHEHDLADKLNRQAAEIWEISENSLRVKLGEERALRMKRMEQMFLQLKAVEAVMERYQERETAMTRMQSLLLATDVLKTAFEDRQTLVAELRHLQHLGETDPFIRTVVASLPSSALATGAASERQLLRSFATVKAAARRVAHVPDNGGFWSYVTSYVISFASFEPRGMVPGDDVESILARADYYIAQENLDLAAREVNQLKGQARQIAHDWLVEARQHLEVTQALKTIQAYLSNVAVGLLQATE